MNNDVISQILVSVLGLMFFILIVLVVVLVVLKLKENEKEKTTVKEGLKDRKNPAIKPQKKSQQFSKDYTKQSIMDFMEFEKVEDNMIIQKKGKRFLMVIECQGVNYDLMSRVEKVGVEEGFQQFLNTLRHPIQIHIQTRAVNLESSLNTYKRKIHEIEDKYNKMVYNYNSMKESDVYTQEDLAKEFFEITKQRNLLEYANDLMKNTEKMSLNKNVLTKKYFIVIPYYSEEAGNEKYDYEELKNIAFSELYTNSQSIIRTLSSCSVVGKILNSRELVELLYVAYNREESEVFGIDKALRAGYDELYSTAPDVFERKIKALDETIREKAIDLANETIDKVKSKAQQKAEEKEDNFKEIVKKMAEMILDENKKYVGKEVAEEAIKEIKKNEGGNGDDDEIKKTTTRGRKRKSTV